MASPEARIWQLEQQSERHSRLIVEAYKLIAGYIEPPAPVQADLKILKEALRGPVRKP